MALIYPEGIDDPQFGNLNFKQKNEKTQVFITINRSVYSNTIAPEKKIEPWHLLDFSSKSDEMCMYPFTVRNEFCDYKYDAVKSITLRGFSFDFTIEMSQYYLYDLLLTLPAAFVKDYNYGLGLKKEYLCFIRNLEGIGVSDLVISKDDKTNFNQSTKIFTLKFSEFESIRKGLNRVIESCRSVSQFLKDKRSYNYISYFLNDPKFPQKPVIIDDRLINKLVEQTEFKINSKPDSSTDEAIQIIKNKSVKIIREQPETLMKLRNDLELVTLNQLIENFEINLKKRLKEEYWQQLFNSNPFILTMAFGYPIIKINQQASVGGHKIDRSGEKIVDFLVKNSFSQNIALFEIKTPGTKLLNAQPYRDGIYQPAAELTGAVNQVLDQKYKLEKSISIIKDNSRMYDLETYAVHGVLIASLLPKHPDQLKSFELYRNNSKSVVILTFDEVLEKLKQLLAYLSNE